jgi:hypothetical protein
VCGAPERRSFERDHPKVRHLITNCLQLEFT